MRMNIHPADRHKIVNNHVSNWQSIRDRKRIWIRCPGPVSRFHQGKLEIGAILEIRRSGRRSAFLR
jgi:hypothetical protein